MILIPEIVLEAVIRESFKEIRENPEKLDDWLGIYKESFLTSVYGQATINSIKKYLQDNEISTVLAWNDIPSKIPCITLSTLDFTEDANNAFLGDYGYTEDITTEPEIIADPFEITSYNNKTGNAIFAPGTPMTAVLPGQIFISATGDEFPILNITDTFINIGTEALNVVGIGRIVGNIDFYRERHLAVPVTHRILLSVHTEDAFLTKNLHYLLVYILLSAKNKLTNRGLLLTTWAASDFAREVEKLPEHIYTRSLEINMRTFFQWLEARDALASSSGVKIRVQKDIYDRVDGDIFSVDTTED